MSLIADMFSVRYPAKPNKWFFISSYQIPITLDFKWIEVSSKMISEVWTDGQSQTISEMRHCVFKLFFRKDRKWELHRFSSPGFTEKAVYVMHRSEFTSPVRKRKRKIDAPLSGPNS